MRHFSLLIGNETRGPLTEEEISAMIAEGSVTADTLCAPAGAQAWVPLSDHFSFGSNLKIKRAKQVSTEAEEQAAAVRIDPDLRKKLLVYGLADAATVDGFTQVQALTAVLAKESSLRAHLRLHKAARIASFVFAVPAAFALGLFAPIVPSALGLIASASVPEQGSVRVELEKWRQSAKQMRISVRKLQTLAFEAPSGDIPAGDAVANRMHTDQSTSFVLRGRLRPSEGFRKNFGHANQGRRMRLLKEMPSGRLLELLRASEEKLAAGAADWTAFQSKQGREMEKLLQDATLKTAAIDEKGGFVLEAIPPINASMSGLLIAEIPLNGAKAFTAWTPPLLEVAAWDAQLLASSFFVSREKYFVSKKLEVGGRKLKARIVTPLHTFEMTKTSPVWRYLAVARKEDQEPLYLLVDEKTYAATKAGQPMEIERLVKLRCFANPAESPTPPGLEAN